MKKFSREFKPSGPTTVTKLTQGQRAKINAAMRDFDIERRKNTAGAIKAGMDARLLKR